jgi:hypothetical protein
LHSGCFDSGEGKELEAEEELFGDGVDSPPGGLEANELESHCRGLQRVHSLDVETQSVFALSTIGFDLGCRMLQGISKTMLDEVDLI